MRSIVVISLLTLGIVFPTNLACECLPYTLAREHIGEIQCITGKVIRIREDRGVTLFDFCEIAEVCPFNVVAFAQDLRDIGDVRQLQNKVIEIHGPIKEYDGRAEIVLQHYRQLRGEAAKIPALPKTYDVERHGHYSAGKFSLPRPAHAKRKKKQIPQLTMRIPEDSQSD